MTDTVKVTEEEAGATTTVETNEDGTQETAVETTPAKTTVEVEKDGDQ